MMPHTTGSGDAGRKNTRRLETKKLTYAQAQQRLEQIVKDIEENSEDIDRLSLLLKEAKDLIAFCKKKLYKVEEDVRKVMGDDTGA